MSDSATHVRGDTTTLHPITGEPPGIREILERRTAGEIHGTSPPPEPPAAADPIETGDDADRVAAELNAWRQRGTEAESRLAEERQARLAAQTNAAAERQARVAAETAATTARQGAEDTGFTAITTALGAAERETEALKIEMKGAGDAGDFSRMAEISVRLGQLGAETLQLQQGKEQYERQRTTRVTERPADPPTTPAPAAEPDAATATERGILRQVGAATREQFLATRTQPTADWLRSHPEFFTDQSFNTRVMGADQLARGRGITIDTPEYFKLIETESGVRQPPPPARQPAPDARVPGAAPTREAPGPTGRPSTRPGDVYVSAEDKTAAGWMGIDPAEYAAEKERLTRTGEIPYRRR